MKRRVNIAAGLVHQPRLLFLDEPTVGVDPQSRNQIFESVLRLNRERGMSIIYTSHYMEEVEHLCSRAAIIDGGRIIALDTIKNLINMLGGGVIYVGVSSADEELLRQMADLPAVDEVTLVQREASQGTSGGAGSPSGARPGTGETIKVVAKQSQQAVLNVINFVNQRDLALTSLEILEPNLESVFLHLTGKKLRE